MTKLFDRSDLGRVRNPHICRCVLEIQARLSSAVLTSSFLKAFVLLAVCHTVTYVVCGNFNEHQRDWHLRIASLQTLLVLLSSDSPDRHTGRYFQNTFLLLFTITAMHFNPQLLLPRQTVMGPTAFNPTSMCNQTLIMRYIDVHCAHMLIM